ncbi:uncharacterized protein HKW66_Vig0191390 [Vigna angularis]|uniref:Uncharacterized protein n=1 Tax=Phaseolus angularis TaxID=3914 RepID=A0A8T0KQ31_PHAAN|nr:uncharacterized protein HKW66_Vig0191390 [Vigna angularis]
MDICMAYCVVVAVVVESGELGKASFWVVVVVVEKGICRVSFWVVVVVVSGVGESGGVDEEGVGGGAVFEMVVVVDWDGDRASCKEVVGERHAGFLKFEMGD